MHDFNIELKYIAAAIGSFIGAGLHGLKVTLAKIPLSLQDAIIGTIEFFFQLFAGFFGAIYFGPHISQIHIAGFVIDPNAAIFGVGLTFYKLLPLILEGSAKFLDTVIKKIGG